MNADCAVALKEWPGPYENTIQAFVCKGQVKSTNLQLYSQQQGRESNLVPLVYKNKPVPSDSAVTGVSLRPLACWEYGFESRLRHGCLSLLSAVCYEIQISETG